MLSGDQAGLPHCLFLLASQLALIVSPASWLISVTSFDAFVQGSLGGRRLQIDLASPMQSQLMKLDNFHTFTRDIQCKIPIVRPVIPSYLCDYSLDK